MKNPLSIFFGPDVVISLRAKPQALRRIAERIKPILMGQVHPDSGETSHGPSAEISEAYEILRSTEDLEPLVSEFLASVSKDELKRKLREATEQAKSSRVKIQGLESKVHQLEETLKEERGKRHDVATALWQWIITGAVMGKRSPASIRHLPRAPFPEGSLHRGAFFHFIIVVEEPDCYIAYRVDIAGRVIDELRGERLEDVANGSLFKRQSRPEADPDARVLPANSHMLIGGTKDPIPSSDYVSGKSEGLLNAVRDGLFRPYLSVGMYPVFIPTSDFEATRLLFEPSIGKVVAFIPIKHQRNELITKGRKVKKKPDYLARIRAHLKKKKEEAKAQKKKGGE